MKKILILMILSLSALSAQSHKDSLKSFYTKKIGGSTTACRYVNGKFTMILSDSHYEVAKGYLLCTWRDNLITVFEYSVEEEDRAIAVNIGDILISSAR